LVLVQSLRLWSQSLRPSMYYGIVVTDLGGGVFITAGSDGIHSVLGIVEMTIYVVHADSYNIEHQAVSVLHNVQLLLNKQQQFWGGVYIH